jgi:hypothetical protein
MAGIAIGDFPRHDIQVRGLRAPLAIRVIGSAAALGEHERPSLFAETA